MIVRPIHIAARAAIAPALLGLSLLLSGCQVLGVGSPDATPVPTAAPTAVPVPATAVPTTAPASGQNGGSTGQASTAVKQWSSPPRMTIDTSKSDYRVVMHTNQGDFTITLLPKEAPLAANNFLFLARQHFYDGVIFHRIIKTFMIQGGDPAGTGSGGPGYGFAIEPPKHQDYTPGIVAMANTGQPNSNGSQFFIMTGDYSNGKLPKSYSIFGKVTAGLDIVQKIASAPVDDPTSQSPRPLHDVRILSTTVQG